MKVFISWSGELSNQIAKELSVWLRSMIHTIDVFFSQEDIKKGENWDNRLTSELESSDYGIVCLTSENVVTPWIHFEAGALSKKLDAKVTALMVDVVTSDIQGPLSRFQATKLEKEDFYKLVKNINEEAGNKVDESTLRNTFDAVWEKMYPKIEDILNNTQNAKKNKKVEKNESVTVVLEELLQLVRKQDALLSNPEKVLPLDYLKNIVYESNKDRNLLGKDIKEIEDIIELFCNELLFFIKDNLLVSPGIKTLCLRFLQCIEYLGVSKTFLEFWKKRFDTCILNNNVELKLREFEIGLLEDTEK